MTESRTNILCAIVDESLPVKREIYGSISIAANGKGFSFKLNLLRRQVNWRMSATPQYHRLGDRKLEQIYPFLGVEVIHFNNRMVSFYGNRPTIHCRMLFNSSELLHTLLRKPKDHDGILIFQEASIDLYLEGFSMKQLYKMRDSIIVDPLTRREHPFKFWINPKNCQHSLGPHKVARLHNMFTYKDMEPVSQFFKVASLIRKQLSAYDERLAREAAAEEERQKQLANHRHGLWCGLKKSVSKNFTKVFRK